MAKHVWQGNVFEGSPVEPSGGATVTVRRSSDSATATVYADVGGASTIANPISVVTGFLRVYLDSGTYNISMVSSSGTRTLENVEVGLNGESSSDLNPVPLLGSIVLGPEDSSSYYTYDLAADVVVTLPDMSSVALGAGFTACFDRKDGAGNIEFIGSDIKRNSNDSLFVADNGVVQIGKRNATDDQFSIFGQLKPLATYVREQCVDMGSAFGVGAVAGNDIGNMIAGKLYDLNGFVSSELNGGTSGDKIQIRFIFPASEYAISSIVGDGDTGSAPKFFSDNAGSGVDSYITIASDDAANKKATISGCIRPTVDGTLLYEIYSTGATMDLDRGLLKITEAPQ